MNNKDYINLYSTYAFMQVLADNGWTACNALELHRKETEALLENDLRQSLHDRHTELTEAELTRVVANLRNTDCGRAYLTLRSIFTLYRDGYVMSRDDQSLPDMHVQYIDFEHPERNIFRAVNQLTMIEGKENRRPDIMLYVNGIPVCIIELKNPADPDADIYKAWEQIHIRYRRDIPSLMKYCALSCISDGANSRLGTTYSPYEHYYAWKKCIMRTKLLAAWPRCKRLSPEPTLLCACSAYCVTLSISPT